MTAFEAGFLKYAEEYGMSSDRASHMFKRALEHPEAERMFKEMPDEKIKSPASLEALRDLLEQQYAHEGMEEHERKLAM